MNKIIATLKFLDQALRIILKVITLACFFLLTLIVTANIVFRFWPIISLLWSDEIITLLFAYLIFYGAAALWISNEHFSSGGWITRKIFKADKIKHIYRLIIELGILIFAVVFCYFSWQLTISTAAVTNVLGLPKQLLYSCMPISGLIMVIYSIRDVVKELIVLGKVNSQNPLSQAKEIKITDR